jgi:hypothetical protein
LKARVLHSPWGTLQNGEHAHTNSTGGLRGDGNGARLWTTVGCCGASPVSMCRRRRAQGRERAARDASSPPREALGGLLNDGQASAERSYSGSGARVRRAAALAELG